MWKFDNLLATTDDGVVTISINREEKLNALNIATVKELRSAIQNVYDSQEIKGVIITGVGSKAFVAGADIEEIAKLNELNGRKFAENGQEVFQMIERLGCRYAGCQCQEQYHNTCGHNLWGHQCRSTNGMRSMVR